MLHIPLSDHIPHLPSTYFYLQRTHPYLVHPVLRSSSSKGIHLRSILHPQRPSPFEPPTPFICTQEEEYHIMQPASSQIMLEEEKDCSRGECH